MRVGSATDHGGFAVKELDHMNVLCMGGRTVGPAVAWNLVQTFLAAEYSQFLGLEPGRFRRNMKTPFGSCS